MAGSLLRNSSSVSIINKENTIPEIGKSEIVSLMHARAIHRWPVVFGATEGGRERIKDCNNATLNIPVDSEP